MDDGSARPADGRRTLVAAPRPGLPKGAYATNWSVVCGDALPVGGSLRSGYGVPANTAAAARPGAPPSPGR